MSASVLSIPKGLPRHACSTIDPDKAIENAAWKLKAVDQFNFIIYKQKRHLEKYYIHFLAPCGFVKFDK